MNAKDFRKVLIESNACEEAVEWSEGKDWETVHSACYRGDWLLWLYAKTADLTIESNLRLLILVRGLCANTVIHLMTDERSIKAVSTAIAYGEGSATLKELRDASNAASCAAEAAEAVNASNASYASYAAYAAYAVNAAEAVNASNASNAVNAVNASYAAYAANAAYYAANAANAFNAADAAAYKENRLLTAEICRKYLPLETWTL